MRKILFLTILIPLLSCAQKTIAEKGNALDSIVIMPGKVKYLEFTASDEMKKDPFIVCDHQKIQLFLNQEKSKYYAYYAEDYFSERKSFVCTYASHGSSGKLNFIVQKFPYEEELLNVDERKVEPKAKDLPRIFSEQKIIAQAYKNGANDALFDKPFSTPLESELTSIYGKKRVFNNKKKTQHLGTDFRAAIGVPIPSSNKGRVVLAMDLFFSGKTVIIDHGLSIYTMYAHLSDLKVKKDDLVTQGQIIALSGATGRVTAPHLHWGVKINNFWVDGLSLIDESKKNF